MTQKFGHQLGLAKILSIVPNQILVARLTECGKTGGTAYVRKTEIP